jgi:hypothetical protein
LREPVKIAQSTQIAKIYGAKTILSAGKIPNLGGLSQTRALRIIAWIGAGGSGQPTSYLAY